MRTVAIVFAGLAIAAGGLGMPMSFLFLASGSMPDITAGTSGFVAGAILVGSGLISFAILASREPHGPSPDPRQDDFRRRSATDVTA
jgi:hypothetical protein